MLEEKERLRVEMFGCWSHAQNSLYIVNNGSSKGSPLVPKQPVHGK